MKSYFITGTGTGIGKTLVACALAWQLLRDGHIVKALKPVISGFDDANPEGSDSKALLDAQDLSLRELDMISPWRFKAPLSPDMAALEEDKSLPFDKVISFCQSQAENDILLIEGVGGVMSPLDDSHTVLDWMAHLQFPVILVAGSYLGSLSHTLTAYEAIRQRGLKLQAVIVSESENAPVSPERSVGSLKQFIAPEVPVFLLKRLDYSVHLWEYAPSLTSLVL